MESKGISREEARASLDAVGDVERKVGSRSAATVTANVIAALGFGVAVAGTVMQNGWVWVALAISAILMIYGIVSASRDTRNVRASYKQPVQNEDITSTPWLSVAVPIIAFTVVTILPKGSPTVAVASGLATAVVVFFCLQHQLASSSGQARDE